MKRLRQLQGVAVSFVVHVHHVRRYLVEVVVQAGDLKAVVEQSRHHGGNFFVKQHQVAHDHRVVVQLLEGSV